ncbi:unnamed protein product, partial [Mesorhabditis belari]|uniref:G-protein coupled receptors family 1 profile domain-containing protein n=1 Tax=Mesorhabditis belari TaxID=2138241 RepID=A0AAF3F5Z3_9BILA
MHSINHSDCFQNLTQEEHFFQHENAAEVEKMFLHYHGYLLGSLASLAILFSTAFIAAQLRVIRLREGSRKYHALLLNRAIGDLIGASTAVISAILAIFVPTSITAIAAFIGCFFYSTFWTAFVSYTCLSLVKLYAVWKPFLYRRAFTFKKCLYIIGVSWIIFVCCGSLCVGAMSHLHVGWVAEWHGFRYLFSTFFCFDYAFTIVTFLVTAAILKKASKVALLKSKNDGRSTQQRSRSQIPSLEAGTKREHICRFSIASRCMESLLIDKKRLSFSNTLFGNDWNTSFCWRCCSFANHYGLFAFVNHRFTVSSFLSRLLWCFTRMFLFSDHLSIIDNAKHFNGFCISKTTKEHSTVDYRLIKKSQNIYKTSTNTKQNKTKIYDLLLTIQSFSAIDSEASV